MHSIDLIDFTKYFIFWGFKESSWSLNFEYLLWSVTCFSIIFAPRTVAAIAALASNAALASEQLAKEKNCLACHAVDHKVVGPGYKEVAAKYKGDKSAEAKLATKIQKGGGGVWGQIPMPANPQVSDAEAKKLAQWILSLK